MPADYKSHRSKPEKKTLPGFVWLLAGLSIGLFIAFLVYLEGQPENKNSFTTAVKKELERIKPNVKTEKKEKPVDKNEPKFNFYTILPELEVLIPDTETQPPESRPGTGSDGMTADSRQYVLQAGSFQKSEDAEKLKASLALIGFEANIQNVTINREQWHRVRMGPFQNSRELYKKLNILHRHDINAMPMVLRKD